MQSLKCACAALAIAVLSACGGKAEDHVLRADRYVSQKKYSDAVIEYRKAIQINPQLGNAHLKLADIYSQIGDVQSAYGEYLRAADTSPESNDAQLKAGAMLLMAGRFAEAKGKAQIVLKRQPKNAGALMLLGNALAGTHDLRGAIERVKEAIDLDPGGLGYANLANLQLARGDLQLAEASYRKAINASPDSMTARSALAHFYQLQGRTADAEAVLIEALRTEPRNVQANSNLAELYIRSGRAPLAEAPLKIVAEVMKSTGAQMMLVEYYIRANRGREAAALLDKLADDKESYALAKARLAALDFGDGKAVEAHKTLDDILKREPNNGSVMLIKAKLLATQHRLDEAMALAKSAAVGNPSLAADSTLVLAQIYLDRGQSEEAEESFKRALSLDPRSIPAMLALARLSGVRGESRQAIGYAQQAAVLAPSNGEVLLTLSHALVEGGDYPRAEKILHDLSQWYPNSALVQIQLAQLGIKRHDAVATRAAFTRALQIDSRSFEATTGLVMLDVEEKKGSAATERVEGLVRANPKSSRVHFLAGQTYYGLGDLVRAETELMQAAELDPNNFQAYALLGATYGRQNKIDEALRQFQAIAARRPRSVAANTMIAILYERQGQQAEAQKVYERILEIDPRAAVAANNLAWSYAESDGNIDVAYQLAQTAKIEMPIDPQVNDTLGWIQYKKDLIFQAIQLISIAVDAAPSNPQFHFHLGMAYAKQGDERRALVSLRRALALSDHFPEAVEARRAITELTTMQ